MKTKLITILTTGFFLCLSATVNASPIIPEGLNPGDTYQLVFVTNGARNASSTSIQDYNDFVQAEAALNPALSGTDEGVTYNAIGSTETVNAMVNAPVVAPVYLFDGITLVALDSSDMWDGVLAAAIKLNQNADERITRVWTGTDSNGGTNYFSLGGIHSGLGIVGWSDRTDSTWVHNHAGGTGSEYSLYGLSTPLIVPDPTHIPASGTWGLGVLTLVFLSGLALVVCMKRMREPRNA